MNYPTNYPTDSPNRRALSTEKHARPITITYNIIITWSLWMKANMAKFGIHQSAAFKHIHLVCETKFTRTSCIERAR